MEDWNSIFSTEMKVILHVIHAILDSKIGVSKKTYWEE